MPASTPRPAPEPPDSIDFELTDFDSARIALDEPPAGVKALRQTHPDHWLAQRRPLDPRELQLRASTLAWLRTLDPDLRPRELLARFPRVANQVAESWGDPVRGLRVLGGLLMDQRGNRRGFPFGVAAELTTLHDHLQARARLRG